MKKITLSRRFPVLVTALCLAVIFSASAQRDKASAVSEIILPGDEVQISVFREPDLSLKTRVASNGKVTLHLIGAIKLAGLSPKDAEQTVREAYAKDVLVNPSVSLSVYPQQREPGSFTVAGQVSSQGNFKFPPNRNTLSIMEAIGTAGGFTRYANRKNVKVRRATDGGTKVLEIDTKEITRDKDAKDFLILPGDVIYVEEYIFAP